MCDKLCLKCPNRILLYPTKTMEPDARAMLQIGGVVIPMEKTTKPDTIWILKQQGAVAYAEEGVFLPQMGKDSTWVETAVDWRRRTHDHPFLVVPVKSVIWWLDAKDLVLFNNPVFSQSPCERIKTKEFQRLNVDNDEAVVTLLDKPGVYGFASEKECEQGQYMFICAQ